MANAMNWETAGEKAEELSQGIIIKMKAGQEIEGVFRGEPVMDRKHFIDQKPIECIGLPHCPLCQNGQKPSIKFYVNFAAKTRDGYSMRVLGMSTTVFTKLNTIRSKIKTDFNKTVFSITREGEGLDTEYVIIPQGEALDIAKVDELLINNIVEVVDRPLKNENDGVPFK